METTRFNSFCEATDRVLRHLRASSSMSTWFVAHLHGDAWRTIAADDPVFGMEPEDALNRASPRDGKLHPNLLGRPIPFAADHPIGTSSAEKSLPAVRTFIAVPLIGRKGRLLGALCGMDQRPPSGHDERAGDLLALLAGLLGQLLENELDRATLAQTNERFRHEAMTDALTQLPNRRAWEEKLKHEQSGPAGVGDPLFVSVIDLDSLKEINDREGHSAGDRLLCAAAQVLDSAVRRSDFVARVGGDEFAVTGRPFGKIDAGRITARFDAALGRAGIDASVGTALAAAPNGLHDAWAEADRVMYREKRLRASPARDSA